MDFFNIGDHINVKDYNSLVYLLRKFKRLTASLTLGALTLESDYGSFSFDKPLTSVGGNFIIEQEVNVSSSDCLRNCFYSFVFNVIDVNTSGIVNKRQVKVTGGTGDDGVLFVTLPTDLIESDEVILPDFELDIVFDEHEYYTPVVDVVNVELVSDKRFVGVGETATVTATLKDREGNVLADTPCNFVVNGVAYSETTDSDGQAEYQYTGTGVSSKIDIRVVTTRLTIYDSVMTATVTGGSVSLGRNMIATGDILIDWGDGTTTTRQSGNTGKSSHTYTDGLNEHTICFVGEITSLGETCFYGCIGLTSISIPDSVTSLGTSCFDGCIGLTSVTIPNSVTSIGDDCFIYCTGLTSVTIPNSVTSIGDDCFIYCTGLTSVSIPSSVTSLGDLCFYNCSSLVDYQLYWKDSAILEYVSSKMPVKTNTYFTIPQGQRSQYIAKNYPNKIKIRGYDLSLTTDKIVITEDETSTVTATLTYNMEPIADETVSYTIRQGSTIIDTGTETTDSDGEIEVEYTGTSTGKITIQITYDTLTETTTIYDTIKYDKATTTDHNDNFWASTTNITRKTNYSTIGSNDIQLIYTSITGDLCIEFDVRTNADNTSIISNIRNNSTSLYDLRKNRLNVGDDWKHIKLEIQDNLLSVDGTSITDVSVTGFNRFYLRVLAGKVLDFKDIMVYSIGGSSKVDTSISISSDKASYYTDESIVLTGSLTDEDDLPLVGADVKVYRGASLIDTVSTDSTGTYEKRVTGLSAGSYSFKAVYDGDDTYQGSMSSSLSVIVQNHTYSLSIGSDKQIILTTESVKITGTLLKDSTAYASQSVELYDGVTKIATLTTDGTGEYEETVSGLSVGTHSFKAVNSNAESSTVTVTVSEPAPVHDYSLTLASTKDILSYADSESATITATLTDNGSAVAGETLSYVVKHGTTTIDSGSDTTDSSGQISFTYASTGIGDVTVEVSYGMSLQETYEVEDCIIYDPLTSASGKWTIPSGVTSSYSSDGWKISANAYKQIKLTDKLTSACSVEFTISDYYASDLGRYPPVIVYQYTNGETTPNQVLLMLWNASSFDALSTRIDHALIKGGVYKIEYTNSTMKVYENGTLLASASNSVGLPTRFEFHMGTNGRYAVYKDLKVKAL